MPMTLTWDGPVAIITWDDGENRINLDSLARLNQLLSELSSVEGPLAVVWTGVGKFFSNGLDLARFGANPAELTATLHELNSTVARLTLFPAYTVAALNGHTFAGGALLSCGVDYRVMREDRGFWCMNEVQIGLPLDDRLASILFNRLPRATALHAMMTGHRFSGPEAQAAGIVEEVAGEEEVLARALEVAHERAALDRPTLAVHKRIAFGDFTRALGAPLA